MKAVMFPGASLMKFTVLDDGLHVKCPGCGREQVFREELAADFAHEDGCPVFARIQRATRLYERGMNHG